MQSIALAYANIKVRYEWNHAEGGEFSDEVNFGTISWKKKKLTRKKSSGPAVKLEDRQKLKPPGKNFLSRTLSQFMPASPSIKKPVELVAVTTDGDDNGKKTYTLTSEDDDDQQTARLSNYRFMSKPFEGRALVEIKDTRLLAKVTKLLELSETKLSVKSQTLFIYLFEEQAFLVSVGPDVTIQQSHDKKTVKVLKKHLSISMCFANKLLYKSLVHAVTDAKEMKFSDFYDLGRKEHDTYYGSLWECKDSISKRKAFFVKDILRSAAPGAKGGGISREQEALEIKLPGLTQHPRITSTKDIFNDAYNLRIVYESFPVSEPWISIFQTSK
mmetsp:Transcript_21955/g.54252  ORF Transcript_21955/g.54252 Transcript_21955/m.54252 type:complete len:329 (-) Transcript_21955:662-1648(-)